jgi:hypothetical protein
VFLAAKKKATSRFLSHFGWFNAHHLEANN